jgi:hypothetical protein
MCEPAWFEYKIVLINPPQKNESTHQRTSDEAVGKHHIKQHASEPTTAILWVVVLFLQSGLEVIPHP